MKLLGENGVPKELDWARTLPKMVFVATYI